MLDDFSHEVDQTHSKLDNVMKKLAKVSHMTSGKLPGNRVLGPWNSGCTIIFISSISPANDRPTVTRVTLSIRFVFTRQLDSVCTFAFWLSISSLYRYRPQHSTAYRCKEIATPNWARPCRLSMWGFGVSPQAYHSFPNGRRWSAQYLFSAILYFQKPCSPCSNLTALASLLFTVFIEQIGLENTQDIAHLN